MKPIEKKRARRMRLTGRVSESRMDDHLSTLHPHSEADKDKRCYVCDKGGNIFKKRTPRSCNCRKRRQGNPRVDKGMCCSGERKRIYQWRKEGRVLLEKVRSGRPLLDEEDRSPRKSHSPKRFTIERKWTRDDSWVLHRRYRTAESRDRALASLRRSSRGTHEYRIGPDLA